MIQDSSSIIIKASAYRGHAKDFTLSLASGPNKNSPGTNYNSIKGIEAWK